MQTSAHTADADLFGDVPQPAPAAELQCQFDGTLAADAVVRVRMHDHGHGVPVLCLELEDVGPARGRIHAEIPYPATDHGRLQADIAATHCKRGMRKRLISPALGMQLVLPHARSITNLE